MVTAHKANKARKRSKALATLHNVNKVLIKRRAKKEMIARVEELVSGERMRMGVRGDVKDRVVLKQKGGEDG